MPDEVDPLAAENENNTPDAPPSRMEPLRTSERMDVGCLAMMIGGFIVLFFLPAFFLLGGAPFIIPLLLLFLVACATPFINPTERRPPQAQWTGRILTFLGLALLLLAAWYYIFLREAPALLE
jgi:hypothetical protein